MSPKSIKLVNIIFFIINVLNKSIDDFLPKTFKMIKDKYTFLPVLDYSSCSILYGIYRNISNFFL